MSEAFNMSQCQSRSLEGESLSYLADEELGARAQSLTLAMPVSTRPVRVGVASFWIVVGLLLTARFLAIDPADLKPVAAASSSVVTAASSASAKL